MGELAARVVVVVAVVVENQMKEVDHMICHKFHSRVGAVQVAMVTMEMTTLTKNLTFIKHRSQQK